ncbi:MAG: hypothetical protein FWH21_05575, partial [Kiritimatiellaeota bacterium]|nr:hypothetical protein [Kiritimatiellota bacterium]
GGAGSVIPAPPRFPRAGAPFSPRTKSFGGPEPVRDETFRLPFPRKTPPPSAETFHGDGITFTAVTNRESVTWQWHMAAPPLVRTEELLPPWHFHQPAVFVSFGTWRDFSRTLNRAFDNASDANRAVRKHARQLVKGVSDPLAKMRLIRDDVLRTIRPAGPSFLDLPLASLTPPDRTLADQYGHAADRALLLAEMLDAVGIDAELVFVSLDRTGYPAYSRPQRTIPQRGYFSQPLVRVRIKGGVYYLNEGDQYDEPGVSAMHRAPLLPRGGKIETLQIPPPLQNITRNATVIDLDERGTASITVTNWYCGTSAGPFRKQYTEMLPEDRRRHHLELISGISKSAVAASDLMTDVDAYPPLRTYTVTAPDYAVLEGERPREPPSLPGGGTLTLLIPVGGGLFPLRGDTRKNPLFFGSNDTGEQRVTIVLPPGYTRTPLLPEPKRWELPNGLGTFDFTVDTRTRPDGRREITLIRRHDLAAGEVPAQLYPALLEYNRLLTHPSTRTLVAERE